jgi:hypothetical protein
VVTVQNSTRTQQSAGLETREASHNAFFRPTSSSSFQILIANPQLKSELSANDPNQLQISNRERMAIRRFILSSRPALVRLLLATHHSLVLTGPKSNQGSSATAFLIVTLRLKSLATTTKQDPNPISNRYKSPFLLRFFAHHPSLVTRHASLLPPPPGKL